MALSITLKAIGLSETVGEFVRMRGRLANMTPAMKDIGEQMDYSILENFRVGGRPRWRPSKRARRTGGKTLVDKAHLRNSTEIHPGKRQVTVMSRKPYAAVHQYGFKGNVRQNVRAHTRTQDGVPHRVRSFTRTLKQNIPARPFILVQPEDRAYANDRLERWVTTGR